MSDHFTRRGRRVMPSLFFFNDTATTESDPRAEIARLARELEEARAELGRVVRYLSGALSRDFGVNVGDSVEPGRASSLAASTAAGLDGARERERGSWRPIETAPKDGTRILIGWENEVRAAYWDPEFDSEWDDDADDLVRRGAWTDGAVLSFGYEETKEYEPTHWMPLPPAPGAALAAPQEASEPQEVPRCKYGYKLNGCELGHPGCACADDMLAGELEAMEP